MENTMTTPVKLIVVFLSGQTIFVNSTLTSSTNFFISAGAKIDIFSSASCLFLLRLFVFFAMFVNHFLLKVRHVLSNIHKHKWQARRESNPQHPDLESGALPIRATGLQKLFRFFMRGMCPAEWAVLFQLQFSWSISFIFCRGVVPVFTSSTRKGYDISHDSS